MPTFASIGLHPDLHRRLFAKTASTPHHHRRPDPTSTTTASNRDDDDDDDSEFHVISTPMELLNRNPKQQLYLQLLVVPPPPPPPPPKSSISSHHHCDGATTTANTTTTTATTTRKNKIRPISIRHVHRLRYQVAVACLQPQQQKSTGPRPRRHYPTRAETSRIPRGMTSFTGMLRASDLLPQEMARTDAPLYPFCLPTGCPALDQQLLPTVPPPWRHFRTKPAQEPGGGGIPLGQITQISGPPASGKTQFVVSLMASSVAATTTSIFWIGNSTAHMVRVTQRLQDLLRSRSVSSSSSSDRITTLLLLQRIHCTVATTSYQLLHRLQEFEATLLVPNHHHDDNNNNNEPPNDHAPPSVKMNHSHTVLLVIDSCSGCCPDVMHPENGTTHLVIGQVIRRLTRQYHLATVLINGTVSNTHHQHSTSHPPNHPKPAISAHTTTTTIRTNKPALGYRWNETIPDIAIWFQPCGTTTMYDHRRQPQMQSQVSETTASDQNVTPTTIIQVTMDRYPRHVAANLPSSSSSIYFGIGPKGIQTMDVSHKSIQCL